jgi:hypothetical protein
MRPNAAKAFVRGNKNYKHCFFFLFILPIIFVFLSWKFLTCSVEGDGNVLSDIASGKACHTEGTLLQAAV